jgi:ABC-type sulfate transport system permease component
MKLIKALAFTLFLFGLFGWIYIAGNAWFHPRTLPMALTHFAPYPREDTFGSICFIVSFVSFFVWNIIRYTENKNRT